MFDQAPAAIVAPSAPDVLGEVAQAVLGSLGRLPDEERQVLVGTLRTWLAWGGSSEATAKVLSCPIPALCATGSTRLCSDFYDA